jgi:TetR/AcrR family transcriptional regulator, lmrAB and yxaGH operons repressor
MPTIAPSLPHTTSDAAEQDTRGRILMAAQRLFRKRGYHATGLNDILQLANAPKGSMYHHFPGGKEAIGVSVIQDITASLLAMLNNSRARSTDALVTQAGEQLTVVMEKTNYEICALFSAFAIEHKTSPALGQAVGTAYNQLSAVVQQRLQADGLSARAAKDLALIVTALLEGGSLLSQAQQNSSAFRLSVKQAAALCKAARAG